MADTDRLSPLAHLVERLAEASEPGAVRFDEIAFATQLTVRLDPASTAAGEAARVLGGPLPTEPNTAARYGGLDVLWMGPDEWLVVAPDGVRGELEGALRDAFTGAHASVVDVSAQRTIVEVVGPAARDVLAKGCALDLHPSAFGAGRCAQTLLARAHVILLARAEEPVYWVLVRASFADYLAEWLLDASLEERTEAAAAVGDAVVVGAR